MSEPLRLCQFAPAVNRGDAMSRQAIAMHLEARAAGLEAALFEFGHGDDNSVPKQLYDEYTPRSGDVIVLHYGGRRHYEDWVVRQPGRVYVYSHNVTPPHFFERIGFPWVEALYRGRDTLAGLSHLGGLAVSRYNQIEMLRAGFRDVRIIPLIIDFDALQEATHTPEALEIVERYHADGVVNWLHVGRLVPSKRIEDIIRAFYIYHRHINPNSRLFLVGSGRDMEAYTQPLCEWVNRLGLQQAVIFTGRVSDEALAGFYKLASLYVCMSEHEGFCVPLVEAMVHQIPVIAYRAAGIPYTMGDAGVLVEDKDPVLVAQIAHILCTDRTYREQIIAGQLARAQVWHPDRAREAFAAWLHTLMGNEHEHTQQTAHCHRAGATSDRFRPFSL
jgi:glycosyltransferase involved in cell wall biosynthesis